MGERQDNGSWTDLSEVFKELENQVPVKAKVDVKKERPGADKVVEYNREIIATYLKGEATHLEQQKTVGIIIALAVGLQLIAFNVLIYIITLKTYDIEVMRVLLDFMKYYTGAVIVEMLGLCLVVVKGVYSMSIGKMVEHILKKKR